MNKKNAENAGDIKKNYISNLKTALLTPFDTGNIGTVAQAYATQALIEQLGYKNELFYFHYDAIQNPFLLSNLKKRGLKKYLGSIAGLLMRYPAKKGLWRFINRHIHLTERVKGKQLKKLADRFNSDLYLLPSSVHEILAVRTDQNRDISLLMDMVQDANQTVVRDEDYLSNCIYYFDRKKCEIKIAVPTTANIR